MCPPLVFISHEGRIWVEDKLPKPPIEEVTSYEWDMEQLRKQAEEEARKASTKKKVTE